VPFIATPQTRPELEELLDEELLELEDELLELEELEELLELLDEELLDEEELLELLDEDVIPEVLDDELDELLLELDELEELDDELLELDESIGPPQAARVVITDAKSAERKPLAVIGDILLKVKPSSRSPRGTGVLVLLLGAITLAICQGHK
jgi:hypothetical protein